MNKTLPLFKYLTAGAVTLFVSFSNSQPQSSDGVDINASIVSILEKNDIVFLGESHAITEQIATLSAIYSDARVKAASGAVATEMVLAQDRPDFESFLWTGEGRPLFEKRIKDLVWYRYKGYRNLMQTIQHSKWKGCGVDYMDFIHAGSDDRETIATDRASIFHTFPDRVQRKMAEKLSVPIEIVPSAKGPDLIREFSIAASILGCIDRFGPKLIVQMGAHHGTSLNPQLRPGILSEGPSMPALDWIHFLRPDLKIAVVHLGIMNEKTEGESPFDSLLRRANASLGSGGPARLFSTQSFSPEVRSIMSLQDGDTGEANTYPFPYYGLADYWIFGPPGHQAPRTAGQ